METHFFEISYIAMKHISAVRGFQGWVTLSFARDTAERISHEVSVRLGLLCFALYASAKLRGPHSTDICSMKRMEQICGRCRAIHFRMTIRPIAITDSAPLLPTSTNKASCAFIC